MHKKENITIENINLITIEKGIEDSMWVKIYFDKEYDRNIVIKELYNKIHKAVKNFESRLEIRIYLCSDLIMTGQDEHGYYFIIKQMTNEHCYTCDCTYNDYIPPFNSLVNFEYPDRCIPYLGTKWKIDMNINIYSKITRYSSKYKSIGMRDLIDFCPNEDPLKVSTITMNSLMDICYNILIQTIYSTEEYFKDLVEKKLIYKLTLIDAKKYLNKDIYSVLKIRLNNYRLDY